mmetsp:Transcript_24841/g.57049  ORF Transcript_24841/g.57049 Transcript_24841/m.57049 type:complete len:109 (-) Transcript_24841:1494-1820(-)
MFQKDGPDVEIFDYSTLLFSCRPQKGAVSPLYLDLIPIRMPARYDEGYLFSEDQVGPTEFARLKKLDIVRFLGTQLPPLDSVGRIENLPIFPTKDNTTRIRNAKEAAP